MMTTCYYCLHSSHGNCSGRFTKNISSKYAQQTNTISQLNSQLHSSLQVTISGSCGFLTTYLNCNLNNFYLLLEIFWYCSWAARLHSRRRLRDNFVGGGGAARPAYGSSPCSWYWTWDLWLCRCNCHMIHAVSVSVYFAHRAGAPRLEFFHRQVSIKTAIWHKTVWTWQVYTT